MSEERRKRKRINKEREERREKTEQNEQRVPIILNLNIILIYFILKLI